jgi:hypothetical protein
MYHASGTEKLDQKELIMPIYAMPSTIEGQDASVFKDFPPTLTTFAPRATPVQEFCASQGISDDVRTAIGVAINVFPIPIGGAIGVELGEDDEIEDRFVVINVPVVGTCESIHRAYRAYLHHTRSLSSYAKSRIRLMVDPT